MTASSEGPGTWGGLQFVLVSQSPPLGELATFHVIVDITVRSSRPSSKGRRLRDRLRPTSRPCRRGSETIDESRTGRFMGVALFPETGANWVEYRHV